MKATKLFVVFAVVLVVESSLWGGGSGVAQSAAGAGLLEKLNDIETSEGTDAANQAFYALSAEDQQADTDYLTGPLSISPSAESIESTESSSQAAAASGCWNATTVIEGRRASWPNSLFFKYNQYVNWCGNGSTVSNVRCSAYPSSLGYGYRFSNHLSYCVTTVSNGWQISRFSQGSFCAGLEWCWVNRTPWLRQSVTANGGYWSSKGGL
ncbi:MAG: hypothetical protein H0T72_12775 [Chloroflexia bacterium]|jgi:hypothetical protein|nr:hypothetical protein [Chloroflexia bacterium]